MFLIFTPSSALCSAKILNNHNIKKQIITEDFLHQFYIYIYLSLLSFEIVLFYPKHIEKRLNAMHRRALEWWKQPYCYSSGWHSHFGFVNLVPRSFCRKHYFKGQQLLGPDYCTFFFVADISSKAAQCCEKMQLSIMSHPSHSFSV